MLECNVFEETSVQELETEFDIFNLKDLSCFDPDLVLSENCGRKKICVEGSFKGKDGKAIVIFEQNIFTEGDLHELLKDTTELNQTFHNDVYRNFEYFSDNKNLNGLTTTVIYPADEADIKQYQSYPAYIIHETPELYHDVTLPHIEHSQLNLKWVYNILEHKADEEKILLEDKCPTLGFVLLPHLNWDGKFVEDLHLVAIVQQHDIKTLRDLTPQHVPLLKNIREKVFKFIKEKYNLSSSQIAVFMHYLPSYYHLHVHFAHLSCSDAGTNVEEAHLLTQIIDNIGLLPNYYSKAVLPFIINETHDLFKVYKEKGLLEEKVLKEIPAIFQTAGPSTSATGPPTEAAGPSKAE